MSGASLAVQYLGAGPPLILLNGYVRGRRALAEGIPDSRMVAFEGAGHAFMAQEPRRAAELIGGFLARQG